jgi:hypothetical protein
LHVIGFLAVVKQVNILSSLSSSDIIAVMLLVASGGDILIKDTDLVTACSKDYCYPILTMLTVLNVRAVY